LTFAAAHRLMGHEGNCAMIHGHNYVAFVTACAKELDGIGRVIDFKELKKQIGGWIDMWWDHGILLNENDEVLVHAIQSFNNEGHTSLSMPQKMYLMQGNPTAENMAQELARYSTNLVQESIVVTEVTIFETENCSATWRKDGNTV